MKTKQIGKCFIFGGLLLIAAALCLVFYNQYKNLQAANASAEALEEIRVETEFPQEKDLLPTPELAPPQQEENEPHVESELVIPEYIRDPNMEMPTKEIDGENYIGVLDIPALELSLPIIGQWSYPRLEIAPCCYQGSVYLNNMIIAAHNYSSHFGGLINLKIGDRVYFTDIDGNVFSYEAVELENLGGSDVEKMTSGNWDLTLFTCTIGGKTRVTVRCERVE